MLEQMTRRVGVPIGAVAVSVLFLGLLAMPSIASANGKNWGGKPPAVKPPVVKPPKDCKPGDPKGCFDRTEPRKPCHSFNRWRQPLFGETHLHTTLSYDASLRFVRATPREAYEFARGGPIRAVNLFGLPGKRNFIDRPIDWGAVTDHAELFGEIGLCSNPNSPARHSMECAILEGFYWQGTPRAFPVPPLQRVFASLGFAIISLPQYPASSRMARTPMCEGNAAACDRAELAVWGEIRQAAEEAYDRSANCEFTSFIGYEMASTPGTVNWHRNVLFRNDRVVERPVTSIDMAREVNPDPTEVPPQMFTKPGGPDINGFFDGLQRGCLDKRNGCDVISIPHNPNLGGGLAFDAGPENGIVLIPDMFADPLTPADAAKRAAFEPLVEVYQHKGASECRFDPRTGTGVQTSDEYCDFELLNTTNLAEASIGGAGEGPPPPEAQNPRTQVRNILKLGMKYEQENGVNPFKLGMVAATDSHNGEMGWAPEDSTWGGGLGMEDANPVNENIASSPGGLAVTWAEENSRDSVFEALKRRETYATSGTRPIVRFFGGWNFNANECNRDFVPTGYQNGVPMGGDLPSPPRGRHGQGGGGGDVPRFIVSADYDEFIGTPLQQIQIVKGWVDRNGDTHEEVYTVAGDPDNGAGVDEQCNRVGTGAESLCSVWADPDFDRNEPAFYYVRVLENPVCRFSTRYCQDEYDVNPLSESCEEQLASLQESNPAKGQLARLCCQGDLSEETRVQPVIQERAWTSPIWYTPGR